MLAEITCCCCGKSHQYILEQLIRAPKLGVIKGWRARFPVSVQQRHPRLQQLSKECWDREPKKRPTSIEIEEQLVEIGKLPTASVDASSAQLEGEDDEEDSDLKALSVAELADLVRDLSKIETIDRHESHSVERLVEVVRHLRITIANSANSSTQNLKAESS